MAYIDGVSLEIEYITPPAGNTFSYATIATSDDYPIINQIIVRWELQTVSTPGGDPVQTTELTASVREQIFRLDPSYLTFSEGASTVTVDGAAVSGATVTVNNEAGGTDDYVYPAFTLINTLSPVKVRRDTDVTTPIIDFQPGSRLSSGQLNASTQQLLFAAQEQSIFGTSAKTSSVDLGSESINNLGDVNINSGNTGALLVVGPDGVITDSTTGGVNEVLSVNGETGAVVLTPAEVGAAAAVHTHSYADITDLSSMSIDEIGDVDTTTVAPAIGDTLLWNGTNWVPHNKVEYAAGSGSPPPSWTDDPTRQAGDIFIRTG